MVIVKIAIRRLLPMTIILMMTSALIPRLSVLLTSMSLIPRVDLCVVLLDYRMAWCWRIVGHLPASPVILVLFDVKVRTM